MDRSLHEQGHTVPFFTFSHPNITIGFSSQTLKMSFSSSQYKYTCGCSSFWIWAMLCRWLLSDTSANPSCCASGALHFLPSTAPRSSLRPMSRLSKLSSLGSASTSRAPQTIAAEADELYVYCHDDGAFLLCCAMQIGVGTLVGHIDPDVSS